MTLFTQQFSYNLEDLKNIIPKLKKPTLVFLYGEVGAGKTTLISQYIAENTQFVAEEITSPTYVYYNTYHDIIHFDLYRLKDFEHFISIGGEELLENNKGVIFIEWPEVLEAYYIPDFKIYITKDIFHTHTRNIKIESNKKLSF